MVPGESPGQGFYFESRIETKSGHRGARLNEESMKHRAWLHCALNLLHKVSCLSIAAGKQARKNADIQCSNCHY